MLSAAPEKMRISFIWRYFSGGNSVRKVSRCHTSQKGQFLMENYCVRYLPGLSWEYVFVENNEETCKQTEATLRFSEESLAFASTLFRSRS